MKQTDVKNLNIAYIGGGSRGWAWTFMTDLAKEKEIAGTVRLYDIDIPAARRNEIIGNHLSSRADVSGKWKYEVKERIEDALEDADFVIISILPKTFDEMEVDVHMPERLGVYQSVGDTAGPGGMMRALRTLPIFLDFAKAIRENCPDAWVVNYTNPMSLCVKALYTGFPEIKAFGCCHEVFGTQKVLAEIVMRTLGEKNVTKDDININVLGINHFTWFDYATYKSFDLFPIYGKYIDDHFEEGLEFGDDNWMNSTFACAHRVKFDLFKRFGWIAAAGDRHLAEFMPGADYLKDPETVKGWKFGLTSVAWRKEDLKHRLERSERLAKGLEEIDINEETGEEGVGMIKALCGLTRKITNVNIPNSGHQIENLPEGAVVETNALFERDAVRPVFAGAVKPDIKELIMPHIMNHERIMKAVLGGNTDIELITEAFENDPLMKGKGTKDEIRKLVTDMMRATL
ncbi:MAG: alpha-glucosidase/alpha-galactosidase [Lachnospiraceae bacterium]|nr:alpha-glucosidase/alpha-galactosidase [Lachnospiraceae bacterium]